MVASIYQLVVSWGMLLGRWRSWLGLDFAFVAFVAFSTVFGIWDVANRMRGDWKAR
jgi:hypothetical protein